MAGATRDQRGTARNGSDRIARLARWLAIPVQSKAVTELVLVQDDGEIIGRWAREDVLGAEDALSYRIDAILVDAANDARNTITARLSWMAGEIAWQSKTFRAVPEAGEQETIRPLDGSMLASLQAGQRHTEALACQLSTITQRSEERMERMFQGYERILEFVLTRLGDAERRRDEAELREQQTLELAEQAAEQADAANAAVDAANADKNDPIAKVIEIAARQLTSGGKP